MEILNLKEYVKERNLSGTTYEHILDTYTQYVQNKIGIIYRHAILEINQQIEKDIKSLINTWRD